MKKIYLASLVLGSLMLAGNAGAVDSTGCGLGSMAWRGQKGMAPQILAVTTNGSFSNQTFGITFGTSGCDPDGRISGGTQKMVLAFIENNMEQYALDAARGEGETITTLAGIMNMDSEKLGQISKQNFAAIFPSENAEAADVTLALFEAVKQQA